MTSSSQLHLSGTLLCLVMMAGIIFGRSHMLLNPALQVAHVSSADEENPERYTLSELELLLSAPDAADVQPEAPSLAALHTGLDLMRRDSGDKERKAGCKNYFWKSRTAC